MAADEERRKNGEKKAAWTFLMEDEAALSVSCPPTQRRRDLFSLEGERSWLTSSLRSSWVLPAESSSDAPPWPSSTLVTPTSSASRLRKVLLDDLLG